MTPTQPTPRRSPSAAKPAVTKRKAVGARPRAASLSMVFEGTAPAKSAGLRTIAPERSIDSLKPTIVAPPQESPVRVLATIQAIPAPVEQAPLPDRDRLPAKPASTDHAVEAGTKPAPPPQPAAKPARSPVTTEEMIAYWNRLRQGRQYPPLSDIDAGFVGDGWPAAILFECASRDSSRERPTGDVLRMSRLGNGTGNIAYTPMMMEWMMSLAREVVQTGKAIEDRDDFPASGSVARYRLVLLPLGEEQKGVGHVLGALERI